MLDLRELDTDDMPGMSRVKGNYLAKAAAVCLESQGHAPGARLMVQGSFDNNYTLAWSEATAQDRRAFTDMNETTEHGAEGIADLLSSREIGYSVVLRSQKGTGVDYWLGDRDDLNVSEAEREQSDKLRLLLEDDSLIVRKRMEVSGIRRGDDRTIRNRVAEKLRQTHRSDQSGLEAYVVVVEFGTPVAEIAER